MMIDNIKNLKEQAKGDPTFRLPTETEALLELKDEIETLKSDVEYLKSELQKLKE